MDSISSTDKQCQSFIAVLRQALQAVRNFSRSSQILKQQNHLNLKWKNWILELAKR